MAEFAAVAASSRMAMEVVSLRPKISYTFFLNIVNTPLVILVIEDSKSLNRIVCLRVYFILYLWLLDRSPFCTEYTMYFPNFVRIGSFYFVV